MAIVVGIDEAGFGPILGPLVVSSSSFSLDNRLLSKDLWQILCKSVGSRRKRLAGRLLIADSKKAYSKQKKIKHLERTALAFLRCLNRRPATLTELLRQMCPDCLERLNSYPWYRDTDSYRLSADAADIEIASAVLRDDLASNQIELLGLQSHCLDVEYYNDMMANVKNKATVLFTATSQLIEQAYDNFSGDCLQIIVDRQGGRVHYRKILQLMFAGMELKILRESPAASSYELQSNGKAMRLHFAVGADERFLPVSLASMVSKYLRELLVDNINRYFTGHCTELRPTAGYWKDGLRFIEDLKTSIPHVQYNSKQLIRCR
jgi:ribonuclease HII